MRKNFNIINSILLVLIVACSSLTIAVAQEAAKEIRIKIEKDVNGEQQSIDKVFTDPNDPELKKLLEEHNMDMDDDMDIDIDVQKQIDEADKDEAATLKLKLKSGDEDQLNEFIDKIEKLAEDMDIDFSDIDISEDDNKQMFNFFGEDFDFEELSEKLKNNSFKLDTMIDFDDDSFNFLSDDLKNKLKDFDLERINPDGRMYDFFNFEEVLANKAIMGVMIDNNEDGILITGLNEGFGAKKAGLQAGDIITAIDNKTMKSVDEIIAYINELEAGDFVTVEYKRDNITETAKVELMPPNEVTIKKQRSFNNDLNAKNKPVMGVMIKSEDDKVVINGITDGFGAEKAGLKEGDIIISVDDEEINSVEAITDYINNLNIGDVIKVQYERAGETKNAEVELMKSEMENEMPEYFNWIEKLKDGDFEVDENFFKKDTRVMIMITDLDKEDEEKLQEISANSKLKTDDLELAHFEFFPNPSEGLFKLSFDVEKPVDTEVNIYDLNGKIVYNKFFKNFSGEFNEAIDLQNNAGGSYILEIIQGEKRNNKKIVVK